MEINMEIKIDGYKNLRNLQLDIDDNKINLIFGLSGSGKSSIADALTNKELEFNKTVGFNDVQKISLNGSSQFENVLVFNNDSVNEYIFSNDLKSIYNVLIDNQKELSKAESKLNDRIDNLIQALSQEKRKYEELLQIKKDLGSDLNKNNEFKATAKIIKIENALNKVKNKKTFEYITSLPIDKYDWLVKGVGYIENQICPFCEKKLSLKKENNFKKIVQFEPKSIENLNIARGKNIELLNSFNLTFKGISSLKSILISCVKAIDNFQKIEEKIYSLKNLDFDQKLQIKLDVDKDLLVHFPEVSSAVKNVNSNLRAVEGAAIESKNKTKQILSRNLKKINEELLKMSIPYEVVAEYANGRIKKYQLTLLEEEQKKDRKKSLSYGEKNIVALLMFVLQCKKENTKLIIIDDPASSYDDYRRHNIFKWIKSELKNKTVLMLSHDSVYSKYAVIDKSRTVGKIYYFDNNASVDKMLTIDNNDIQDFNDFVIDRIKSSSDYFQKIINLRLLFEGGSKTSLVYSYLSAIIHGKSKSEIEVLLRDKKHTIKDVHKNIVKKFPELKMHVPELLDKPTKTIVNYSLIEKAFFVREYYKGLVENNGLLEELNDFIHINRKLKVTLNPYKYSFCTKRLADCMNDILSTYAGN